MFKLSSRAMPHNNFLKLKFSNQTEYNYPITVCGAFIQNISWVLLSPLSSF